MTNIISGKIIRDQILEELRSEVERLTNTGTQPCLAVILVGADPASQVYVGSKRRTSEQLGMRSLSHDLAATTTQEELETLIRQLNDDPTVHGILCQLPLPDGLNESRVIQALSPDKDVDGLHPMNAGLIAMGTPKFISCTPYGVLQLLKRTGVQTSGSHAVVLGRSNLFGRPMATLLSSKGSDATVTTCHSRTRDLPSVTSQADILIAAIGRPEFVTANMVKPGAVVIDVSINRIEDANAPKGSRLIGDVAYGPVSEIASAITPVPGGVGPMTIAMLMVNTVNSARWQQGLPSLEL